MSYSALIEVMTQYEFLTANNTRTSRFRVLAPQLDSSLRL